MLYYVLVSRMPVDKEALNFNNHHETKMGTNPFGDRYQSCSSLRFMERSSGGNRAGNQNLGQNLPIT